MRFRLLVFAPLCLALFAANSKPPDVQRTDLPLIERLNEIVQLRFRTPAPSALGMSRVVLPPSMGHHYQPLLTLERDFAPENEKEREVIRELEEKHVQVGLYVAGVSVVQSSPELLDYRALKGPGAITKGTPRPAWYPGQPPVITASPVITTSIDALPDWKSVYPLAKRAMQSFRDGGAGFETSLEGWNIAARPVVAEARCNVCHDRLSAISNTASTEKKPIGGVLYAFRRDPTPR